MIVMASPFRDYNLPWNLPLPPAREGIVPFTSGQVHIVAVVEWGLLSPSLTTDTRGNTLR